jgi:hypothetical protein
MRPEPLLLLTSVVEAATGVLLLVMPRVVFTLLLGVRSPATEALYVGRVAGAALLAIGIACWEARSDDRSPAQVGLLAGLFTYDLAASTLLASAPIALNSRGIALWPAVGLHAALGAWCLVVLQSRKRTVHGAR